MCARLVAVCALVVLSAGCQPFAVPAAPTLTPLPAQPAPTPTLEPAVPTALPPTVSVPTPTSAVPTLQPATPAPPAVTLTLVPTTASTPIALAIAAVSAATPDPTRAAQQSQCDTAAPPAHLALPLLLPFIHITPPTAQSLPIPAAGGPRQEGTDAAPHVTAPHVAVVDENSGALLYSVDPFTRQAPASITKIVTTIVALEREPDLKKVFTTTVSSTALAACDGSSVMGLEPNDHVTLETLLYGMMLPSGNDAAEQVAYSLAGSRDTYVAWMNEKVASLRLRDTHFVTPSGMDADDHYSSAYDMALLARYAMQNPEFRTLAATPRFVGDDYYMHNLNPLLGTYQGADGVKIGYTDIAGRTIVASATRDGHRVYVSLMGSHNLAGDCVALFEWVWRTFRW
jgi:D-alanyl-D-alanine carboxypeptidase